MPKDIIINQNGTSLTLEDVKYIETYKKDGGTEKWIPEDDAKRTVLETNQPGTYTPPLSSGFVGYSKVTVDGLMPIEDEEEYLILDVTQNGIYQPEKDPRGSLKGYRKVIVRYGESDIYDIDIVRLPDKQTYSDGEPIQYEGLVVKGYDDNGEYVRDIELDELTFPMKTMPDTIIDGDILYFIDVPVEFYRYFDGHKIEVSFEIEVNVQT